MDGGGKRMEGGWKDGRKIIQIYSSKSKFVFEFVVENLDIIKRNICLYILVYDNILVYDYISWDETKLSIVAHVPGEGQFNLNPGVRIFNPIRSVYSKL